jgi:hypothetical protein
MLLAFVLCGRVFYQLGMASQSADSVQALNAAQSAIAVAIAAYENDPTFGTAANRPNVAATPDPRHARTNWGGSLWWRTSSGARPGSFLNMDGTQGWSLSPYLSGIPPKWTAYMLGRGDWGGVTRLSQALIFFPNNPVPLASGGTLDSNSGLIVGGIGPPGSTSFVNYQAWRANPSNTGAALALLASMLPADAASNSKAQPAVDLQGATFISGDVSACGAIQLGPQVVINGGLQADSEAVPIPNLTAESYDPNPPSNFTWPNPSGTITPSPSPRYIPNAQELDQNIYLNSNVNTLESYCKFTTTPNMPTPNTLVWPTQLQLDNAILYVDGNFKAPQGVWGSGTIIATGSIDITGLALKSQAADEALLADGPVTIHGNWNTPPPAAAGQTQFTLPVASGSITTNSIYEGQLYSRAALHCDQLLLFGSFSNLGTPTPPSTTPGGLTVSQSSLLEFSNSGTFNFNLTGSPPNPVALYFHSDGTSTDLGYNCAHFNPGATSPGSPAGVDPVINTPIYVSCYSFCGLTFYGVQDPASGVWNSCISQVGSYVGGGSPGNGSNYTPDSLLFYIDIACSHLKDVNGTSVRGLGEGPSNPGGYGCNAGAGYAGTPLDSSLGALTPSAYDGVTLGFGNNTSSNLDTLMAPVDQIRLLLWRDI